MRSSPTNCCAPSASALYTRTTPRGSGRPRPLASLFTTSRNTAAFCFSGGGKMKTPTGTVDVVPGSFCVHPPGEVHEYINGPQRSLLFRVCNGTDMLTRHIEWRGHPEFKQSAEDAEYYRNNPPAY